MSVIECPFERKCNKSICDNYRYLTVRDSGTPRCDAFREFSEDDVDFFNDTIMKACLRTTIDAIPTFEDFMMEQEDCPQEFVDVVNEHFDDMV
jgi:hypothetical protein